MPLADWPPALMVDKLPREPPDPGRSWWTNISHTRHPSRCASRKHPARDFRPVVADAILAAATKKLGGRNYRKSLSEAGRVGEQLQNILPPWSSSPNTFLVRRMKRFPLPLTSAAFAGVMHFRTSLQ